MKSHDNESMIDAYTQVYTKLDSLGHKIKLHILDNKYSRYIQNFLEKKGIRWHHVTPHDHCFNAAEPAVKTTKYHLIAVLAMLNWNCPIQLRSKVMEQIQNTLNMFRTSESDTTKTA